MTAAVAAPLPVLSIDLLLPSDAAEARKRRREILSSQRLLNPEAFSLEEAPSSKRSKVSDDDMSEASSTKKPAKKPQLRYDPDVPMSKEEAAAWRREQRRKRNRESAAASRQRQRDRIVELEGEVEEWKKKYDEIMSKIRQLEEITGSTSFAEDSAIVNREQTSTPTHEVQTVTPRSSPLVSGSLVSTGDDFDASDFLDVGVEELLPSKMISRPA